MGSFALLLWIIIYWIIQNSYLKCKGEPFYGSCCMSVIKLMAMNLAALLYKSSVMLYKVQWICSYNMLEENQIPTWGTQPYRTEAGSHQLLLELVHQAFQYQLSKPVQKHIVSNVLKIVEWSKRGGWISGWETPILVITWVTHKQYLCHISTVSQSEVKGKSRQFISFRVL